MTQALLVFNMVCWRGETHLSDLRWPRRYWEDVGAAVRLYLDRQFPRAPHRRADVTQDVLSEEARAERWGSCRDLVIEKTDQERIQPTQFWRTIPDRPFLRFRDQFVAVRPYEDRGRALGLAFGFRLLGGISPYLLVWLGVFACLPVLLWTSAEFFDAGYPLAGVTLLILWASSPFVVESLSLAHSGVGFYLVALMGLMGLSVYGVLSERARVSGFLARTLAAGSLFGICALVRSDCLLLVPGFVLALAFAFFRVRRQGRLDANRQSRSMIAPVLRSRLTFVAVLVLFLCPYLLLNPPRPRPTWVSVWEGLGDFDTTKGHYWRDAEAARVLGEVGLTPGGGALFGWLDEAGEAFFRRSVLRDIRGEPQWYLRILRDRVFATVTQEKIWPWNPDSGRWMSLSTHPNQGDMDKYYRLTTTVDWLGAGAWQTEMPVPLLLGPTGILVLWGVGARWVPRLQPARRHLARSLAALSCPAVGALGVPVLVSTASALETQAFAVIYFMGLGLLLDNATRMALAVRRRRRSTLPPA